MSFELKHGDKLHLELRERKLPNGKIVYVIGGQDKSVSPSRVRIGAGSNRQRAIEALKTEFAERVRRISMRLKGDCTLDEAIHKYVEASAPDTYRLARIERIRQTFGGSKQLADILPAEVIEASERAMPKAKNSSRNSAFIGIFAAIHHHAASFGFTPHVRFETLPDDSREGTAVDRSWIDAFRAHCFSPHLRTLVLLMFVSGIRVGKALQLRPEDINLEARVAKVHRDKNGEPHDYVFTEEVARELRALVQDHTGPTVFGYARPQATDKLWNATIERAGIPRVTRHEAGRHSFATTMIVDNKQDVVTTAELGNWRDVSTLMKRYAHARKDRRRATIDKVFGGEQTAPTKPQLRVVNGAVKPNSVPTPDEQI